MLVESGNAWAQIETIGANDTEWWSAFSSTYSLEGYGKYHFQFTTTNVNDGIVYKTWLLVATDGNDSHGGGGTEYFVWRGEGYAWGQGTNSNDAPTQLACSNTYSTANPTGAGIQAAMNGASVDMVITRESRNIYVTATVTPSNGENEFTMSFSYLYGNASSDNIGLFLTVQNAQVVLNTAEQTASWSTVWTTDFSTAPSGVSYSAGGSTNVNISNGYLLYYTSGQNNDRASTFSFNSTAFQVDTDWRLEYDWNSGSANTNGSNVAFSTNKGTAFTMTWAKYATAVTVTDAASTVLTTTLPILGYNKGTCNSWSHITVVGIKDDGIYLTITNGTTTYVNNVKVSSTYGYPATFNGTLGKNVSSMFMDNIVFRTPAVVGHVETPTYLITAPDGTNRKFTLDCLTENTTIYYAASDLEKGDAGWSVYSGEVSTADATIYAYAEDDKGFTSDKMSFATGAGTTITLNAPTLTKIAYADGNYTISISSNQSSLEIEPASTVIKYSIDGGSEQTYSSAFAVSAGSTVAAHIEAAGYVNSSTAELETGIVPNLLVNWTQNYVGLVGGDVTMWQEEGGSYHDCIVSEAGGNYCVYSSDGASASTNANAGFQVYYGSNPRKWMVRPSGGMFNFTAGNASVAIANLTVGQIVKVEWTTSSYGGFGSDSGVNQLNNISYGSVGYYDVTADGTAYFTAARNVYVRNITVYDIPDAATMSIKADKWGTFIAPFDVTIPAGVEAYKVTGVSGTNLVKEAVETTIPANTPVVLNNTTGAAVNETFYGVNTASEDSYTVGYLTGVYTAATIAASDESNVRYVLQTQSGVQAFYKVASDFTATPNKCYLTVPVSPAPVKAFFFGSDDADAIGDVRSKMEDGRNEIYNLAGQRMSKAQKGINIVNGKKVLVK